MLTDEQTMASAQMMDGDMQVNQAAYNYNAWYQVSMCFSFSSYCARSGYVQTVVFLGTPLYLWPSGSC